MIRGEDTARITYSAVTTATSFCLEVGYARLVIKSIGCVGIIAIKFVIGGPSGDSCGGD